MQRLDDESIHPRADLVLVHIHDRFNFETPVLEATIIRERSSEIPGTNDHNGMVVEHSECLADLGTQLADVIADSPGAMTPEVGQVFANLCRVDTSDFSQLLGGAP